MKPELKRRSAIHPVVLILFLYNVLFFSFYTVYAQAAAPLFQLIHLPRKTGYSKIKLGAEIASLKDKASVKKLLKSKNFPSQTTVLLQINRPGNQPVWWTINTGAPSDTEDNNIVLQSRDNAVTKFYTLSDFKTLFKDTLAILDTLRIELYIRDEDYPNNQYMLSSMCGNTNERKPVPFTNRSLVFTKALVTDCMSRPVPVNLFNTSNPDRVLASCKLFFLSFEHKETLMDIVAFMKAQNPDRGLKDIALAVSVYSSNHFGKIYFPQLMNWLEDAAAKQYGDIH